MPTELTTAELDAIRARLNGIRMISGIWYERDIKALLSHADALAAKVARLEGEQ